MLFLLFSLSPFSSSSPPGKSSIKKNHLGCPSLFWLFDQPYSTGATLHTKQYHVYALTKTNSSSSNISNKRIDRISIRSMRSAPEFLSFHSWIHLYMYISIVGNKIYMLRKSISLMLFYWTGFYCIVWFVVYGVNRRPVLHSWREKKILFCMITIGNIVM